MNNSPIELRGTKAYWALVLSWLIPGGGFIMLGQWARGLTYLAIVVVTFSLGLALHGGLVWPSWSIQSEEFNLINNFTFLTQLGGGLPALLSFFSTHPALQGLPPWRFMAAEMNHPNYELGSYYLIVAGAMNYFAVGNFYDRHVNRHPRFMTLDES